MKQSSHVDRWAPRGVARLHPIFSLKKRSLKGKSWWETYGRRVVFFFSSPGVFRKKGKKCYTHIDHTNYENWFILAPTDTHKSCIGKKQLTPFLSNYLCLVFWGNYPKSNFSFFFVVPQRLRCLFFLGGGRLEGVLTWRIIPGIVRGFETPISFSHKRGPFARKGSHNPILRGRKLRKPITMVINHLQPPRTKRFDHGNLRVPPPMPRKTPRK